MFSHFFSSGSFHEEMMFFVDPARRERMKGYREAGFQRPYRPLFREKEQDLGNGQTLLTPFNRTDYRDHFKAYASHFGADIFSDETLLKKKPQKKAGPMSEASPQLRLTGPYKAQPNPEPHDAFWRSNRARNIIVCHYMNRTDLGNGQTLFSFPSDPKDVVYDPLKDELIKKQRPWRQAYKKASAGQTEEAAQHQGAKSAPAFLTLTPRY